MYHPDRINQTLGETIRGVEEFTAEIYPFLCPILMLKSEPIIPGFTNPEHTVVYTQTAIN